MDRARWMWMKTVACTLGVMGLLTGVAWADPAGSANVRQFPLVGTFLGTETLNPQRTFLTTDPIVAEALYYDPNETCAWVAPATIKFFVFNLEGQLVLGRNRDTTGDVFSAPDDAMPKYHLLVALLFPGTLLPGAYTLAFRVEDCTAASVLMSEFYSFRVFAP